MAIASAAFLRRHGYYSKSAAKFGENEAKSDCGGRGQGSGVRSQGGELELGVGEWRLEVRG